MAVFLQRRDLPVPDIAHLTSVEQILSACNSHYLTDGLASLRTIPDHSVDVIWSHAVLEHIRRAEFFPLCCELRRIIRPNGFASHRVDLQDHLGGALNHLRIPTTIWESDGIARSGFYTNRIQYASMLNLFEQAGFSIVSTHVQRWQHLPTPRKHLAPEFRHLSDEVLCVSGFRVLLRPAS